jgi:hypothetical protein
MQTASSSRNTTAQFSCFGQHSDIMRLTVAAAAMFHMGPATPTAGTGSSQLDI